MKTQHAELLNNLCNGMVLNGEFEVFIWILSSQLKKDQ
jgi:hypothetical protein